MINQSKTVGYDQYPVDEPLPLGFKPDSIVHAVIDYALSNEGELRFFYSHFEKLPTTDIDEAIKLIIGRGTESASRAPTYQAGNAGAGRMPTPLDINVAVKSFIFIEIARNKSWSYVPAGDSMTLKEQLTGRYAGLIHVMPDGKIVPAGSKAPTGCKILGFGAIDPPTLDPEIKSYCNPFNLYVQFAQKTKTADGEVVELHLPILMDPDIKHPGGNK